MNTKLTLRMEEKLIKKAKSYAKRSGKSVSQLVADFFAVLGTSKGKKAEDLSPKVQELKGILKGSSVTSEHYRRHLEDKYL